MTEGESHPDIGPAVGSRVAELSVDEATEETKWIKWDPSHVEAQREANLICQDGPIGTAFLPIKDPKAVSFADNTTRAEVTMCPANVDAVAE